MNRLLPVVMFLFGYLVSMPNATTQTAEKPKAVPAKLCIDEIEAKRITITNPAGETVMTLTANPDERGGGAGIWLVSPNGNRVAIVATQTELLIQATSRTPGQSAVSIIVDNVSGPRIFQSRPGSNRIVGGY